MSIGRMTGGRRGASMNHGPTRGFTLAEMMIAITLLLLVFAVAVPFFRTQARAVENASGRSEARANVRYALNAIDRDLRVAGVGVVDQQPLLVLASPTAVAFNADLVSRDSLDVGAVYFDPDADPATVGVLRRTEKITLPGTSVQYPDSTYAQGGPGGAPSSAETISYYVERDASAARADQYTLYRRVNAAAPQVVARGILIPSGQPVFRYLVKDSTGVVTEVPAAQLPLIHSAPHGSVQDANALIDQVIAVRVKLTGLYRDLGTQGDSTRSVESTVRIVNAGLMRASICGAQPRSGGGIDARYTAAPTPRVVITWTPSADETAGERDVERYAIYRRPVSEIAWGEPIGSIAAGSSSYSFADTQVKSGESWVYGVAAQDCTPMNSPISAAPVVAVP